MGKENNVDQHSGDNTDISIHYECTVHALFSTVKSYRYFLQRHILQYHQSIDII